MARQLCKFDGPAIVAYVLRRYDPPPPVRFLRWDDARRTSWPGGPERTNDAVAILERLDEPGRLAYLIIENDTEAKREALHDTCIYQLMLAKEVLTADDQPPVEAVLIRLTGRTPLPRPNLGIPGAHRNEEEPVELHLANEDALATLDAIERRGRRGGRGALEAGVRGPRAGRGAAGVLSRRGHRVRREVALAGDLAARTEGVDDGEVDRDRRVEERR
jgi:hypothetical protein